MSLSAAIAAFPGAPEHSGVFFDFMSDEDLNAFVYTQISSGTAAVIDTNDNSANGVLQFSSVDTTENKGAQIQLDAESFQLTTGKDLWFTTRFKLSEATQSDFLFGFAITDTSLIGSAPSDGFYFQKVDGSTSINLVSRVGSAAKNSWALGAASTNWMRLSFKLASYSTVTGFGTLTAYVDDTVIFSGQVADLPNTEALAMSAAFESGAAAIQTCNLDYIGAWVAR